MSSSVSASDSSGSDSSGNARLTDLEPRLLSQRDDISRRLKTFEPAIPPSVKLIAVTKTFPAEIVRAAYHAGIRDFAENKVQEALSKQAALSDLTDVTWHFIGHVQSNKSRKVVEHFDWIHSVDSLRLANRIDRQATELGKRPKCCLQVKLAADPSKDGFELEDLMAALPALDQLEQIDISGLMVIPPNGLLPHQTQAIFERASALLRSLHSEPFTNLSFQSLSMGMSGDFEAAIAAGSTMVRIGSGLFGARV
ncbi:MAG: YggS family pyridoxal phosphate-dependent enzyme [Cyanobacteria bacterium J06649_5]